MRLAFLNALFFLAVSGSWAWFHVAPPAPPVRLSFTATTNISGFKFRPEPIGEQAADTLATTNLFNGTFYGPKGERVTAFMGEWRADNSKELSVVQHTPDVCWVGAGWTASANDHPSQVKFEFGDEQIPFEVRTFKPPGGGFRELTVWCTLVNGQVYGELSRFTPLEANSSVSPKMKSNETARRLVGGQFLNAVRGRTAGSGDKQFVRFSAPLSGDWRPVLRDLQAFAQQWLTLRKLRVES
jgi:hypothetical protein